MSHSTVLVVIPEHVAEEGLEDALADILEPFDENRETEQYVKKTRQQAIEDQRNEFIYTRDEGNYARYLQDPEKYLAGTHEGHRKYITEDFPKILERLDDDEFMYEHAARYEDVDDEGNIVSTYNPKSKWDWYVVGGRWDRSVLNPVLVKHHPERKVTETYTEPAWDEYGNGVNYCRKKDVTTKRTTFAFLDRDGEWHEQGSMGWWGMVADKKDGDAWEDEFNALFDKVNDGDWLMVVDVHI
jgi:hypothetical protein